jgi:RNA polymerase sigma-70 factor (ECF subfamily)
MSVAHSIPDLAGGDRAELERGSHAGATVRPRRVHDGRLRIGEVLDTRQFMWLLMQNQAELAGYARRLTGRNAEASDLVQETCRRAIESRVRFTVGSDMRAWLCCILRNLHRDRLRRRSRETLVGDHDVQFAMPAPEPTPTWARVSDDDLQLAVASLHPQYRDAFVLHEIDGRSYGDIARELRVPSSTVGTRILRARQHLRSFLLDRLGRQG